MESAQKPDFAVEWWPIGRPKPYPNNARKWSAKAVEKVAASIREFGWRQPLVCDASDVIIIGHLRLAAAQSLGLTEVPVHVARDLSPAKVRALRLADNRLHEEAAWDEDLLREDMLDMRALDLDMSMTGFESRELELMVMPKGHNGSAQSVMEGLEFRIVVDCESEQAQLAMLERFEAEGLTCRPLIS